MSKRTWSDAVDADALGAQLARQRLGEPHQCGLADGVHAERGARVEGGEGGDEHHVAPLSCSHNTLSPVGA